LRHGRYLFNPPFKDELITSWITRNALEYGIKPSNLSTLIFEDTEAWKSDIDVYLNLKRIEILSKNTGVSEDTITDLTFYTSCDYFYNQTEKTPQVKWVMPLGVRTRKKSFGLQYCPCCLIEDGKRPYFRKKWRLGFMTCCTDHSVQLHDRCPNCHDPIDIKRPQKREDEILYHPEDMAHCSSCGFDLRKTKYTISSKEEYEINRINFIQSTLGYGKVGCLEFNYSNLYFEGIRRLLSFLICSPKCEKFFIELRNQMGLYQPYHRELIGRNIEPERLNLEFRRTGLLMTYYLLKNWPDKFIENCHKFNITAHLIKTPYLEFPFWIVDAFFFHIQTKKYFSSSREKEHIIRYFEKSLKKKITLKQTTRFVNYYLKK
jgi:hypothetical protein